MNTKKILLFLLIAFGISWSSAALLYVCGVSYGSKLSVAIVATFYMMAPAAAALIVQKLIYKQPIKNLGFDFKKTKWKQLFWLPVVQILFCVLTILVIVLLGNTLKIEAFGFYSFDKTLFDGRMAEIMAATGATSMPPIPIPPVVLLIISIVSSVFVGGIINFIFTLGEELGWRGFLYNETRQLGFWKSSLLIGTIWGFWHAPIILQGHNYPEHPVIGVFMMVPFCIALGLLMSWFRARTNSVLAPAFFHGMVNAGASGVMLFAYQYNDLFGNIAGMAGVLACAVIILFIAVFDKKTISKENILAQEESLVAPE